jgi:hypothetical protein
LLRAAGGRLLWGVPVGVGGVASGRLRLVMRGAARSGAG